MRRVIFWSISIALSLALAACSGGGPAVPAAGGGNGDGGGVSSGKTGAQILLTDAPGPFQNVFVNIVDIAVHQPGGPWKSLTLTDQDQDVNFDGVADIVVQANGSLLVDLIALRGTSAMIASDTLAAGKYTMIRFILSNQNSAVKNNGDVIDLKVPSGTKTGIKIGNTFEVAQGSMTDVLLDFDAQQSIKMTGGGKALLQPVITSPEATPASLRWELLEPSLKPPVRERHDMVFDQGCDVIVVYGGSNGTVSPGVTYADTWEYDPVTDVWSLTNPSSPPGARRTHRMAYDTARDQTVMFGGFQPGTGLMNDTWEYDSGVWTQVVTGSSPSPRFSHDMAYDQKRGVVVLFGENGGGDQTWEYDGTNWTQKAPAAKPAARSGTAMAYDSIAETIILFGGRGTAAAGSPLYNDLWSYDGTNWTQLIADGTPGAPARRARHDMAFDASRNKIVIFGGKGGTPTAAGSYALGDTMEYNGAMWKETFAEGGPDVPSKRYSQAITVYDDHRNRLVLFGGRDDGGTPMDDLWLYGWLPLDL